MAREAAVRFKKREAKWRRVVARQAESGMSIRAYCAQHGVKDPVFYWWRAELARRDAARSTAAFVPVVVEPAAAVPAEGMIIELRGGRALRLPASLTMEKIGELIRAVEGVTA
jgi:transposase-like protein